MFIILLIIDSMCRLYEELSFEKEPKSSSDSVEKKLHHNAEFILKKLKGWKCTVNWLNTQFAYLHPVHERRECDDELALTFTNVHLPYLHL